jgi:hypothetical protein
MRPEDGSKALEEETWRSPDDPEERPAVGPFSRRQVIAGLGAAAAASGLSALPATDAAAQGTTRSRAVGAPATGRTAMEFVGRIDQNGVNFVAYGFFTFLDGLERKHLFTTLSDPRSESAARFTFHATASLVQRSIIDERVFVVDVNGTLNHYFQNTPGATFADPATFARGTRIARSSLRFQNALSTIAANEGIPTLEGPMVQETKSGRFPLAGKNRRFGHKGLRTHVYATGRGTRTEATAPLVSLSIAGNAIVIG